MALPLATSHGEDIVVYLIACDGLINLSNDLPTHIFKGMVSIVNSDHCSMITKKLYMSTREKLLPEKLQSIFGGYHLE